MPLTAGQRLGAYEIVSSLGAGGMGEVYRARDTRLSRDVALKVLPPDVTGEADRLERFDREARAIAALNHPHIVTIYSTEEADGIRFLTRELVDGSTLSDLVMSAGMAIPKFLDIAIPLADALAAAHQKHITHRDLKPGNVMVSHDGRVKVLDFGLARVGGGAAGDDSLIATRAPITHQGMIVGTMPYMSPEQVEGRTIDPRSDLFSLGVIFYELLSGERPFKGSSSPALMSAILRDAPRRIGERRTDIPDPLERLIDRLLEKRPEDRVQTARDVYNELRHIKQQFAGSTSMTRRTGDRGAQSVKVLPFAARGSDPGVGALAEGLPEEIANGLSRFGHARVVSGDRQSADADYAIDGQIRQAGSSVRIGVKLVRVTNGETLWSQNFDRQLHDDFFSLQDDVANRIVTTIGDPTGVLARTMLASIASLAAGQLTIAELTLRFYAYNERLNQEEHAQLREAFERALEREPTAAEGWACLAQLYRHEYSQDLNPLPDPLERQRRAAARAVELDANSQMAWVSLASAHLFARDGAGLHLAVDRAVELNPLNAVALTMCAQYLSAAGDHERAVALAERALLLKPQRPGWLHMPAFGYHFVRANYEEALREAKAINLPKFAIGAIAEASAAGMLGKVEEARTALRAIEEHNPHCLDPDRAREALGKWVWDESYLDALIEGFRKALAGSDTTARKPPSSTSRSTSQSAADPSIAVLPFTDLSEKKDQDWFCDGIAEEIMNALAALPGLRVVARASAFSFRGKADDLEAIADKLNVATVLEGSVRRSGDRVRITTQLSDTRLGKVLWSERFDRELKDIFDVQDEIARAIADRLRVSITGGARLVQQATTNIEAYQLLLQGRTLVTRRGRAVLDAIPLFERAIALDPNLSEAHALLGDAYRVLALYGVVPPIENMTKAYASAERALSIDPTQAEALATLAIMATVYEWNLDEMRVRSDRALSADPNHVRANAERAISVAFTDMPGGAWTDEVLTHIGRARSLDPLNAWVMAVEASIFIVIGRLDDAIVRARQAIDLDRNNFTAHWFYAWALAEAGREAEAIAATDAGLSMSNRHPLLLATLSTIYSRRGELDKVEAIGDELRERAATTHIGSGARAVVAAGGGRWDEARTLLASAIAERDPYVAFWKLYAWQPVWKDRGCAELLLGTSFFRNSAGELKTGHPRLPD
jgi:TolB-like protein/cytochrome c-type biogenesis protein CcmH/NrfG